MSWSERGLTLVELLLATAITAMIASILGTTIYQAVTVPEFGTAKLTAIHEVENAGYWLRHDGQMASAASGGSELRLTLPDSTVITYGLSGTALLRTAGSSEMTLAQSISATTFTVTDRLITMNITSSPPGRPGVSQQATFHVYLRPSGDGG